MTVTSRQVLVAHQPWDWKLPLAMERSRERPEERQRRRMWRTSPQPLPAPHPSPLPALTLTRHQLDLEQQPAVLCVRRVLGTRYSTSTAPLITSISGDQSTGGDHSHLLPDLPLCVDAGRNVRVLYMEIVGCRTEESAYPFRPAAMLFHGITGGHIQGIMEEMERRSKSADSRLAKTIQVNGRETRMPPLSPEKPALCAGCGGKISDRYYLLAVDKQWHLRCLKCCECKLALESELTCFAKDGSIYCKEDYYRRFSVQRCARCHLGISASEMVMRARESVYHLSCFTCTTCNKTLSTGDHFGMKENLVYCRAHFELLVQGDFHPQLNYTELSAKGGGLSALPYFTNGTGTVQKGRPRKRKSPALGVDIINYTSGKIL
ncbi:unnamed protein product [Ranitomeya imitator]|uniref:LIM zinc-binding domain-containing protein n=1 Tax=Ranitomeya imitator TaxID=111125 RepID=A0ABN9MMS8_9NEOB|nr:unnamed protein product [Ranitomeya imitator]